LVAQTDPHHRYFTLQSGLDGLNGFIYHLRITRSIGDQDTIKINVMPCRSPGRSQTRERRWRSVYRAILRREEIVVPGHADNTHISRKQTAYNCA
jgi:hypothetical protein